MNLKSYLQKYTMFEGLKLQLNDICVTSREVFESKLRRGEPTYRVYYIYYVGD